MQNLFKNYIVENQLLENKNRILIALSGGADSVALFHLFLHLELDIEIAVAHCNFCLRDKESDDDEKFVRKLAKKHDVQLFVKRFDTKKYAREHKISIEMAARDLRYKWFKTLIDANGFQALATGHHLDDAIETIFINLARGTGIHGLKGIPPKNNFVVRPLLFATRDEIVSYCKTNDLPFRSDSSNCSNDFVRNRIRNLVLPEFEKINQGFKKNMQQNITRFRQMSQILKHYVENEFRNCYTIKNQQTILFIDELKKLKYPETVVFEFLREYNFTNHLVAEIIQSYDSSSGKQFFSPTHRLIKDRKNLIITKITRPANKTFTIDETTNELHEPIRLKIEKIKDLKEFKLVKNTDIAYFDLDKLKFPLRIRNWQNGDYFQPFGMKNKKKVSDFFIDQKLSLFEKETSFLLLSENKIAWIIGRRIDERFKIDKTTRGILKIQFIRQDNS